MLLIEQKPKELLQEFLDEYLTTHLVNRSKAEEMIKNAIAYYTGDKNKRDQMFHLIDLENKWYKSFCKDFSIYDDDYYFTDLWACWVTYSRKYIRLLIKPNSINNQYSVYDFTKNITSALDLGCGIGFTTSSLKQIYPNARVSATNIENTKQFKFCKIMSEKYNFAIYPDVKKISGNQDLIFASEYFEHIENPVAHLEDVLQLNPKFLIIANSFNTRSMGHFTHYQHKDKIILENKMNKIFNDALRDNNYIKVKTNFWNNRPAFWRSNN